MTGYLNEYFGFIPCYGHCYTMISIVSTKVIYIYIINLY